ncbi:MAG: hypothetical protein LBC98_06845 [Prevotellaceae bacterium]|jgi:hypothetical protein|nr:hypothetical protein [Prevotellaceae bacterium]
MKKFYVLSIIIFAFGINAFSQTNSNIGDYFTVSPATEGSALKLTPLEKYKTATTATKTAVLNEVLTAYKVRLALIDFGDKNELWGINPSNQISLLDSVDFNKIDLQRFSHKNSNQLLNSRWFTYYGGNFVFSKGLYNIMANGRFGYFLLHNRWDAGVSMGLGVSNGAGNFNIGLDSKYYFPVEIKAQQIAPYLGLGISEYLTFGSNKSSSFNLIFMGGISYKLGAGSLDFGLQYGTASKFMASIGYTFFPFR